MGLVLLGFSSREASKINLFSTVAGGGLLGCGALDRCCRTDTGVGGGALFGDGRLFATGNAGATVFGDGIGVASETELLFPAGAFAALLGTIW
ncbi:MAG: hypothetical protein WCF10_14540 [Polyangiales bacterium]